MVLDAEVVDQEVTDQIEAEIDEDMELVDSSRR